MRQVLAMISRIKKFAGRSQRAITFAGICLAVIFVIGSISIVRYRSVKSSIATINYSELYAIAESGTAASVLIENDSFVVTRTGGAVVQSTVAGESFRQTVVEQFRTRHVPV